MPFKMKGSPLKAIGDIKGKVQGPRATPPTAADFTPIVVTTPSKKKTVSSGNAFQKAASKLGVKDPNTTKLSTKSAERFGANIVAKDSIKSTSASKVSSDLTKKTTAKTTKPTEAPKSRKEIKLAKVKNKAAKVKSDYNAGSRGQMEGKAARAKHDRLNKRAARIEKRIAKKNKK